MSRTIYLIRVALGEEWEGFLSEAGEPVEFERLEDAEKAKAAVLEGVGTFDLFEAWDVLGEPRPGIVSAQVWRAEPLVQPVVYSPTV